MEEEVKTGEVQAVEQENSDQVLTEEVTNQTAETQIVQAEEQGEKTEADQTTVNENEASGEAEESSQNEETEEEKETVAENVAEEVVAEKEAKEEAEKKAEQEAKKIAEKQKKLEEERLRKENIKREAEAKKVEKQKQKEEKKAEKVRLKEERLAEIERQRQQVIEEEKNMTEDELYAKIQTEKLLKRKKQKKIGVLIGAGFAFALVLCVIILGTVPVSLMPRCVKDDYYNATLVTEGSTARSHAIEKDSDGFEEFSNLLSDSFKQTYLSSIFSGSLNYYDIDETNDSANDLRNKLLSDGTYYVHLQYANDMTLTLQNGKKYHSVYTPSNKNLWNGELTFKDVYVVVNKDGGVKETKVYLETSRPTISGNEVTGSKKVITAITVKADTSKIFEQWDKLMSLNKSL